MSVAGPLGPTSLAGGSTTGAPLAKTSQELKNEFLANPSTATRTAFTQSDGHGLSKAGIDLLNSIDFTRVTGSKSAWAKLALQVAQKLDDTDGQNVEPLKDYIETTTPIPTETELNALLEGAHPQKPLPLS